MHKLETFTLCSSFSHLDKRKIIANIRLHILMESSLTKKIRERTEICAGEKGVIGKV